MFCDECAGSGVIYPVSDMLFDADKYMHHHIASAHGSSAMALLNLDKKLNGLSQHQQQLMEHFYRGSSDALIQNDLSIGSASTVRNHRFQLKEREIQAKVFLALCQLISSRQNEGVSTNVANQPHSNETEQNDCYGTSSSEVCAVLQQYFVGGITGVLNNFPSKKKRAIIVLRELIKRFDPDKVYTEVQVNNIIKTAYADFVTVRRCFIEYGFMQRKDDGSAYWRIKKSNIEFIGEYFNGDAHMKIDKEKIKNTPINAGVFCIKNKDNGKILVLGTTDLKTMNGKRFELLMGSSRNKQLQQDWNIYGETVFEFTVLYKLDEKEQHNLDEMLPQQRRKTMKNYESIWINKFIADGLSSY